MQPQTILNVWIRSAALARGSYSIDIPNWGGIEILPCSARVRHLFRRAAPGTESRFKQRIVLHPIGDALELLIEEPI